ncbi:MAG: tRNA (N6-isopentenyl adenosine(37)-C2)-methylthiotransferase MiaB [Clostridia bacterium]|nr:tRNA (N6-isopentenyl adenosine(37)-C2)-methylthiotransferase MiaB [Clostridia bacterium]MBP3706757.1 tRNA (N6-isopentenyl adenosine(37)-C2)-methylthiotransferase MiaB [Clostridia bacterium]
MLLARHGKKPKAYIVTYGCQQNVSDSEKIKGMLHVCGYEFTDSPEDAQFILFNTCAVRGHAEDRVLGNVGAMKKHKKENPDIIIAICGCMAQQQVNADRFTKSYPYVDIIFGTQVTHRLPEFIYKRITSQKRIKELALDNEKIVENVPICRDGTFKAFVSVMYGCNNFCSYCIVPYVRGAERSRESKEIIKEVEELVAAGYKEIMLLGQNVNSYGLGLKEDINFARLLRRINEIDGDFRIRFMTSHPKDCTIELLETIRDCEKIERHLHLPFQSGSNRILKMMNRRYTRESYLSLIESAKEIIPDVTFTSDIIVGFPGETKPDFEETLSLIKQVEFLSLFTFIYSPRNGTPAAIMDDPVSREEKGEWFSRLLKLQEEIENKKREEYIGKTYRVLAEEISVKTGRLVGKSSNGIGVEFPANKNLIGEFCTVKIIGYENAFIGEIIR